VITTLVVFGFDKKPMQTVCGVAAPGSHVVQLYKSTQVLTTSRLYINCHQHGLHRLVAAKPDMQKPAHETAATPYNAAQ
jgi:hypothetical protein